mmetsp:Transcript_27500/g.68977  ORF Transcript_27500/g.68977 Transcript_27500/m.68977 type:complete len:246 (+) Transcript_27500:1202-1939(+)
MTKQRKAMTFGKPMTKRLSSKPVSVHFAHSSEFVHDGDVHLKEKPTPFGDSLRGHFGPEIVCIDRVGTVGRQTNNQELNATQQIEMIQIQGHIDQVEVVEHNKKDDGSQAIETSGSHHKASDYHDPRCSIHVGKWQTIHPLEAVVLGRKERCQIVCLQFGIAMVHKAESFVGHQKTPDDPKSNDPSTVFGLEQTNQPGLNNLSRRFSILGIRFTDTNVGALFGLGRLLGTMSNRHTRQKTRGFSE